MGLQTNKNDSINLPKALRIITGLALIIVFANVGAVFIFGYIDYGMLIFYYFLTGFTVCLFIQKWWAPVLIAIPTVVLAMIDFEMIFVVAYILIPVSMTLLGGAFGLYVINKTRYQ